MSKYIVSHKGNQFRIDIDVQHISIIGASINNKTEWDITIYSASARLDAAKAEKYEKDLHLAYKILLHLQDVAKSNGYNKLRNLSEVVVTDSYGFTLITLNFT